MKVEETFKVLNKDAIEKLKNILFENKPELKDDLENKEKREKIFLAKIEEYNKLANFKNQIKAIYQQKFSNEIKSHVSMLADVWNTLKGKIGIELIDKQWLEIGFQGPDPTTDFRGAGMLGLYNLHDFVVNNKDISYKIFLDATDKIKWYFFAACGINITGAIIEMIEVKI